MNFEVGDKVKHSEYGKGKVIDLDLVTKMGREVCVYFKEPVTHGFHVVWCYARDLTKRKNPWHLMPEKPRPQERDHQPIRVKLASGKKKTQVMCCASAGGGKVEAFHDESNILGTVTAFPNSRYQTTSPDPVVAWKYLEE